MATLTLQGITNLHPEIWDNFIIPEPLEQNLAINCILNICGCNEVRYPDPNYLGWYIGSWCILHSEQIKRMYATTVLEYDPIENYDMSDSIIIENSGEDTEKEQGTDVNVRSGQKEYAYGKKEETTKNQGWTESIEGERIVEKVSSKLSGSAVTTTEHDVSAYNSSVYQHQYKDTVTQSEFPTISEKETESGNGYARKTAPNGVFPDEVKSSGKDIEKYVDVTDRRTPDLTKTFNHGKKMETTEHKHGNIGVTTSQQMIEQERKILAFNVYYWIAGMFEDDVTVCVY